MSFVVNIILVSEIKFQSEFGFIFIVIRYTILDIKKSIFGLRMDIYFSLFLLTS